MVSYSFYIKPSWFPDKNFLMQNNFQRPPIFTVLLSLMIFAVFAPSCKKDIGAGASTQTLRQYFSNASQYTLFNKAMQRAGLDTLLGGAIPYTVFAVGDSGMMQSGFTAAGIDTVDIGQLRRTLLYQMIPGSVTTSNLQYYQETPLTTADSSIQAYLENNNFGLFFNGIPVVGVDSGLANGIIQRLQVMGTPPVGDLYTTAGTIPSLSDYYTILQHFGGTNGVYINLNNASPSSPMTVFFPNNAFFATLGMDNPVAIQQGGYLFNNDAFWGNGQFYTCDFLGGSNIFLNTDQFGNKSYAWFSKDGYSFYPSIQGTPVNPNYQFRIVQANIVATNGVIHIIQSY
jgi:uncharacterized surface protein with fasciclin (FAS1) repeats